MLQAAAAAGYTLLSYREITPRFESGAAVQGHMFAMRLSARPTMTMRMG